MNAKPRRELILHAVEFRMPTDLHTGLPVIAPATAAALVAKHAPWARCYRIERAGIRCIESLPTDRAGDTAAPAAV